MLGRTIRHLALGALTVVTLAPVAVAGAAPDPAPVTPATTSPSQSTRLPVGASPDPVGTWEQAYAKVTGSAGRATASVMASAAAALTVSPSTDLVSGQSVTVSGTGLGTGEVAVVQCEAGVDLAYSCDLRNLQFLTVDPAGDVTIDLTVRRTISGPSGRTDCASAPGACEIVVATGSGAVILARHSIDFDPNAPFPSPSIVADPATGLLAGQTVTVTGSGFAANDQLSVGECAALNPSCYDANIGVTTDSTGSFSASLTLRLRIADGLGLATNCVVVDCVIRASSYFDLDYQAETPISFDPTQPLPPTPTITVTPATGLVHDQQVAVTGTGFEPANYVDIAECTNNGQDYCGDYLTDLQTDASGGFETTVAVSRLVSGYSGGAATIDDCAAVACLLRARSYSDTEAFQFTAVAPIAFDGSVPPPALPTVEVSPNANLPYRAQVAVHGTGYRPGEFVYADFCVTAANAGGCGFGSGFAEDQADGDGNVDLVLTVKRRVSSGGFGDAAVDCIDPGTECSIRLQGQRQYERADAPVTFDPNAPIPPPPTATVTPDHDLGWKQVVDFSGTGFSPGSLYVQQCGTSVEDRPSLSSCRYPGVEATVDADGNLAGSIEVRRMLDSDFGGLPVDCATSVIPCTLQIGYGDPDETASVDLGFDPNSQPPPPPVLHLIPASHLHDGENIGVWGSGYTPGATIGLAPCSGDATAIADSCDLGQAFTAQANENGDFLATYNVQGVIGTSRGATDCTEASETCILASDNVNDLTEFASAPFSVDPVELEVHSTSVVEGTGDVTEGHVMVELAAPIGHPTMVEWRAHPGTASEDDYLSRSGRIMIPAGETEGMIHVRVMADAINEPTERFTVEATEAMGADIVDATATVKIVDDDSVPVVTTRDITFVEGDHGTKIGVVPVWLSAPSGRDVLVSYRTHHDSARSGSDFVSTRGEVVIKAGATGAFIFFDIVNDRQRERTESFTMELRKADHAELQDHVSTVTIQDND